MYALLRGRMVGHLRWQSHINRHDAKGAKRKIKELANLSFGNPDSHTLERRAAILQHASSFQFMPFMVR